MLVKVCKGFELEKEKPNTSEDFFNRSEVTFEEDGVEKTLSVLYVRFFEEKMNEFTPYEENPIIQDGSKPVELKDIVALVCLIKNPGLRHRKRIYINSQVEFASYFKGIDYSKLETLLKSLESNHSFKLQSPLEFILQP
ncbi:hypothetical protein SM124_05260 (plasmid) [Bacillus sp. 31A1R]|uniref:Uncharacterized protein n=1 Tax=Robertmurraya mangrovi TaxID=3098077 RepID=A0ABU5IVH1_9BACI|nr:hypothetical protein [Bacillus sp. 31A1R]MDZ5471147.1 hypothetical protein [Bacillus sp. 31A1R]